MIVKMRAVEVEKLKVTLTCTLTVEQWDAIEEALRRAPGAGGPAWELYLAISKATQRITAEVQEQIKRNGLTEPTA